MYGADSYTALCRALNGKFQIPEAMLPPARYFQPTTAERKDEGWHIYRTVPEGAGEPEWRTKARQALLHAVAEASSSIHSKGKVILNDKDCFSIEELRQELETIAANAGGKRELRAKRTSRTMTCLRRRLLHVIPTSFSTQVSQGLANE